LDQVKFLRVLTLLGNAVGALLSLALFSRLPPKLTLSLSLPLESALIALSAFLPLSYPTVIISSSLIGLCEGLQMVYIPLWIDRNAPLRYQSLMLSLWYTSNACGVSLGGSLNISKDGMYVVLLVRFCLLLVPCSLMIWIID
jgi:MFS family permease